MNDYFKEGLIGISKAGISAIPYAGGIINELIEVRGRVSQNRLNKFVESFLKYISELGIETELLKSESFNDMFYSIIKNVVDTNSEHKLSIFKKILVSNIEREYESSFRETFLDLVLRLDFIQIEILKIYRNTGRSGSMDIPEGQAVSFSELTSKSCKEEIIELIKDYQPDLSTLHLEGKYEFYICDLISKSLLVDKKTVGNTYEDLSYEGLTMLYITDYGKEFLNFIVEA